MSKTSTFVALPESMCDVAQTCHALDTEQATSLIPESLAPWTPQPTKSAWRSHDAAAASEGTKSANGIDRAIQPRWKRFLDIACILLASPVVLPVALGVAILVKCVSPGPLFFRQERIGYRGRRFTCLKFRTMFVGASTAVHEAHCRQLMASDAPLTKLDEDDDPRIIPFGPVIRSMGLDELPQILNVLRGEMSLVGPRPCVPGEYDGYLPEQRRRFQALPGLTGWWQVKGKNSTSFARMIELDLEYLQRRSLRFDVRIMFQTLPLVVRAAWESTRRRFERFRRLSGSTCRETRPSGSCS